MRREAIQPPTRSPLARFGRKVRRHLRARLVAKPRPTILMYHRIADETLDPWGTIVSTAAFASHLEWLAKRRTVLPLSAFTELFRNNALPADAVALTFDDGYADNLEIALPLLEKHGMAATIFLPVEWIERGEPFWWDELQKIVFDHKGKSLRLGERIFRLGEQQSDDRDWRHGAPARTPRQIAFSDVWFDLFSRTSDDREHALLELRSQFRSAAPSRRLPKPITRDQIRHVSGQSLEFGSHSLRHPDLTRLGRSDRKREIVDSMARCEALTGSRPTSFAYPYGIFDEECELLVAKAGFDCACATETAAVGQGSRVFALPRMQVGNWPARKLKLALALL